MEDEWKKKETEFCVGPNPNDKDSDEEDRPPPPPSKDCVDRETQRFAYKGSA